MGISAVSGSSSYGYTSSTSDTTDLEKQKASLQAELSKVSEGSGDQKTKEQKVQQLQLQIQQIDNQIAQRKAKASQENTQRTASAKENSGQNTASEGHIDMYV